MEPEGLLPCSQEPDTGNCPDPEGSSPHSKPILLRLILVLSSHLRVDLPSGLVPSDFPTRILYEFLISPMRMRAIFLHHLLDLITLIIFGEKYKLWNFSSCTSLQLPVISTLIRWNILLSTLFSNTPNLCSSLNVRDQVLHPYKQQVKL
jgi:hypothetical protein